jgi:hypothetical protein
LKVFAGQLVANHDVRGSDPKESSDPSNSNMSLLGEPLFDEVASSGTSARGVSAPGYRLRSRTLGSLADFLNFPFGGKPYEQQVRQGCLATSDAL